MKYALLILLFASVAFALPSPAGYVNDFGNILSNDVLLEQELAYETNTTIEIALVTLDSVPPEYTLFDYGVALFDQWKIGQKGEDNGILVLIVRNGTVGNRMRIILGYGIQGYITGAESGEILDAAMPYYTEGDYDMTARVIIDGLKDKLKFYEVGKVFSQIPEELIKIIFSVFSAFIFIIIAIVSVIMRNRCPYCLRGKLVKKGNYYICQKCGKKVSKKKRYAPVFVAGGFGGSSGGGGFGGFGGGASGGGGAGR
jgi:uncharacterized protein